MLSKIHKVALSGLLACGLVWGAPAFARDLPVVSDTDGTTDIVCLQDSYGDPSGTGSQTLAAPVYCSKAANGVSVPRANAVIDTAGRSTAGAKVTRSHAAVAPFDKYWLCRYIDNYSGTNDYFVPYKTEDEWRKFIANAPSELGAKLCSRPYDSNPDDATDQARKLLYVATTPRADMGDLLGDGSPLKTSFSAAFPYWRAGSAWSAPVKTQSFRCYEDYSEEYCPGGYTCKSGCSTNPLTGVESCTNYNACCRTGTQCKSRNHTWTEKMGLSARGLDSDGDLVSWGDGTPYTLADSDARPCECLHRYVQQGESCVHVPQAGEEACTANSVEPSACMMPQLCRFNVSMINMAMQSGMSSAFTNDINNMAIATVLYQMNIKAALESGQCSQAQTYVNQLNDGVRFVNSYLYQFLIGQGLCTDGTCSSDPCEQMDLFTNWSSFGL